MQARTLETQPPAAALRHNGKTRLQRGDQKKIIRRAIGCGAYLPISGGRSQENIQLNG